MTVKDIMNFNYPTNITDSGTFFHEVTYSIAEFIKSIQLRTEDHNPETNSVYTTLHILDKVIKTTGAVRYKHEDFFRNVTWPNFGQCYTFSVSQELQKLQVSDKRIVLKSM